MNLILLNRDHLCYVNATYYATMWALLGHPQIELCQLYIGDDYLGDIVEAGKDRAQRVEESGWFKTLMKRRWSGGTGQADAAEFVQHFLTQLQPTTFSFKWEKRVMLSSTVVEINDTGGQYIPLTFPVHQMQEHTELDLQTLVTQWHQEHAMCKALLCSTDLVCIHLDRLYKDASGAICKSMLPIKETKNIDLPIFCTEGTDVTWQRYTITAVTCHMGHASSGHFRTLMRVNSIYADDHAMGWLITEDALPNMYVDEWLPWIDSHATVLWYGRMDRTSFVTASVDRTADILALLQ